MTPAYDDGRAVLYVGHVLDVLAGLEAGSVQTCITSPPYFGLRSYQTEPQVWGGSPDCDHEWRSGSRVLQKGTISEKQSTHVGNNGSGFTVHDATCHHCGAWRGELGSEPTPDCGAWARGVEPCSVCFVCHLVVVFRAVRRVLHPTGCMFVNLGDSYSGSGQGGNGGWAERGEAINGNRGSDRPATMYPRLPRSPGLGPKQLLMLPARVALALQADGWTLRSDIIWSKPNPMPESVTDRPTTAHEHLFLLSKQPTYYWDAEAIKEPALSSSLERYKYADGNTRINKGGAYRAKWDEGDRYIGVPTVPDDPAGRNRRSVWTIATEGFPAAHFATYPRKLVEPCVLAGTSARGQCPQCGAPWERTTTTEYVKSPVHGAGSVIGRHYATGANNWDGAGLPRLNKQVETTGWEPGCKCDAGPPQPQTVLDIFAGSGTTLEVARWHQRRAVGIELSESYARLVARRLVQGVLL